MARLGFFRHPPQSRSWNLGFSPRVERLESRLMMDAGGLPLGSPNPAEAEGDMAPDFALVDVNPASPTYNQPVSPRDYLGQLSVWMFGYST